MAWLGDSRIVAVAVSAVGLSCGPSASEDSAPQPGTSSGAAEPEAGGSTSTGGGSSGSQPGTTGSPDPGDPTAASGDGSTGTQPGGGPLGACAFEPAEDFSVAGPFDVTVEAGGPSCTIYRPTALGEEGRRHPTIVWGNGTTFSPSIYDAALRHWASHGFIVAAANTSNAGTGVEMLACLDWVVAQDETRSAPYAGAVDRERVGASGHSQGGGGALMAGRDPRVTVTAPLQPYTEQGFGGFDQSSLSAQNGAMFLLSGEVDSIAPPVPNQQRTFDAANVPVLWGTLAGADHLLAATGNLSGYRGPTTAWFRFHLMCDEDANPCSTTRVRCARTPHGPCRRRTGDAALRPLLRGRR